MKDKNVIIREYKKTDHEDLATVIMKTWEYDKFVSHKPAIQMGRLYLDSCLLNQTFIRVAEVDGKAVGVIMGKNRRTHKKKLSNNLRFLASICKMLMYKEARRNIKIFANISDIDDKLLKDTNKDYMGEVAFFAIDKNCRGLGIGRKLFEAMVANMKDEEVKDFFLFTDTSCNYKFYEHLGMKRRGQKDGAIEVEGQRKEMEFYIYDYQL